MPIAVTGDNRQRYTLNVSDDSIVVQRDNNQWKYVPNDVRNKRHMIYNVINNPEGVISLNDGEVVLSDNSIILSKVDVNNKDNSKLLEFLSHRTCLYIEVSSVDRPDVYRRYECASFTVNEGSTIVYINTTEIDSNGELNLREKVIVEFK